MGQVVFMAVGLVLPQVSAQAESVRDRLQRAIDVSRELEALGVAPATGMMESMISGRNDPVRKVPRISHVQRYFNACPWSWESDRYFSLERALKRPAPWPTPVNSTALREQLTAADPAMRATAAEALASLMQPEDLPLLAKLLSDPARAAPGLPEPQRFGFGFEPPEENQVQDPVADPLSKHWCWHDVSVAVVVRGNMLLFTNQLFVDEEAFLHWWATRSDARQCLWYWESRLRRELAHAQFEASRSPVSPKQAEAETDRTRRVTAARVAVEKSVLDELMKSPPEVEAKVYLLRNPGLVGNRLDTDTWLDSTWNYPAPPTLRVTAERLLELLDRGNLWEDVNWDHEYNSLAERLGMWADGLFRPEHVPRLRAALQREHDGLSKSAQAALTIGISRLLPAATPEHPDASETRDGELRQTVLHDPDPTVRTDCVMELVRVGLPVNAPLLKQLAFEIHTDDRTRSAVLSGILHALGQPPFSKAKRELLIDLVLDERFRAMWTQSISAINDETCRNRAIKAINAHAGREWISRNLGAALADPSRSAKALVQIRDRVARLRRDVGREGRE